jgi:hypothetical protein
VILNLTNTTGEYLLGKFVVAEATARLGDTPASLVDREKFVGGFYGDFFSYVNLASFVLQMFAVSRIIRLAGVAGAMFVHPAIAFLDYLAVARVPVLTMAAVTKLFDNTIDYSLPGALPAFDTVFLLLALGGLSAAVVSAAIDTHPAADQARGEGAIAVGRRRDSAA